MWREIFIVGGYKLHKLQLQVAYQLPKFYYAEIV